MPGMVIHACNLSTQEWRQENWRFKVRLNYIVKPCLTKQTQTLWKDFTGLVWSPGKGQG